MPVAIFWFFCYIIEDEKYGKEVAMHESTKLKMNTFNRNFRRLFLYVSKDYDRRLSGLLNFAKRVTPNREMKEVVENVEKQIKNNPTVKMYVERLFTDYNPQYTSHLLSNVLINVGFFNTAFEKLNAKEDLPTPFTILISPTMRCNLQCEGCYAGNYTRKDDLPPEVFDRIITEGEDMGVYLYTILGGEPFIYEDLFDIINKHPHSAFQIFTNCTFLDDKKIDKMWKSKNVVPVLSIEGNKEDTDRRRGSGVYEKVVSLMDTLKKQGIPFGYSLTLTRNNFDTVTKPEFYTWLAEKGAFFGWTFLYMPVGKDDDPSRMPTPEQRAYYGKTIRSIRGRYPIFPMDFWNDAPYVGGCIAGGRKYLHINSKGEVEPCIFTHFAVDNIKEKSLREVLNSNFFKEIRSRQPFDKNLLLPCMIIDSPWQLREIVEKTGAYPTHSGADDVLTKFTEQLKEYSEGVRRVLNPVWENEFKEKRPYLYTPAEELEKQEEKKEAKVS